MFWSNLSHYGDLLLASHMNKNRPKNILTSWLPLREGINERWKITLRYKIEKYNQGFEGCGFFFSKNGPTSASFSFIFVFSNKHYNSHNKYMWKNVMSIQYRAPGLEPKAFGSWVSSHNHWTWTPANSIISLYLQIWTIRQVGHAWQLAYFAKAQTIYPNTSNPASKSWSRFSTATMDCHLWQKMFSNIGPWKPWSCRSRRRSRSDDSKSLV